MAERARKATGGRRAAGGAAPLVPGSGDRSAGYFRRTAEPLNAATMAAPVFLTYQVGLLLTGGVGYNGVDFVTALMDLLARRSGVAYGVVLMVLVAGYGVLLWWLRRRGRFDPAYFVPVLFESTVYAALMGSLIVFVVHRVLHLAAVPAASPPRGLAAAVVVSAGAGFYEELVFRAGILGGGAALLRLAGVRRPAAAAVALAVSAVLFSLAHHFVIGSEPFALDRAVYRALAGAVFGGIFLARGFAVGAYTHALYDLFVLLLGGGGAG
jgi:hypothetical protein